MHWSMGISNMKRVLQHATSASRRNRRVEKPTTPWRRHLATDVSESLREANKGRHPKWVAKRRATDGNVSDQTNIALAREEGYVDTVVPKGEGPDNKTVTSGLERKDARLMWLPNERKEARDYFVQERAESHLSDAERGRAAKAASMGYLTKEDSVTEEE